MRVVAANSEKDRIFRAMFKRITRHWRHISIVLAVLLLFIANAVGVFELVLDVDERTISFLAVVRSTEFLVLLGLGVVLSIALPLLKPVWASLMTVVATGPIYYLKFLPSAPQSLISLEYSLLTVLMLFVVHVLISFFTETLKKQRLIEAFAQYVPPQVAEQISRDPERFNLEGESRELSVMFCDVHNFTGIAEQVGPKQLAYLLNTLFTPLTEVLYKHHATIDKYIGDAIMAFWGAPIEDPKHAQHALTAALEIQEVVKQLGPGFQGQWLAGTDRGYRYQYRCDECWQHGFALPDGLYGHW